MPETVQRSQLYEHLEAAATTTAAATCINGIRETIEETEKNHPHSLAFHFPLPIALI